MRTLNHAEVLEFPPVLNQMNLHVQGASMNAQPCTTYMGIRDTSGKLTLRLYETRTSQSRKVSTRKLPELSVRGITLACLYIICKT